MWYNDRGHGLPHVLGRHEVASYEHAKALKKIYNSVIANASPHVRGNLLWLICRPLMNRARHRIYNVCPINAGQAESILHNTTPFSEIYKGSFTFEDQLGLLFASDIMLALCSSK